MEVLDSAEATAAGGRRSGRASSPDGAIDVRLTVL
jgi:hypothetical protein